MVGLGDVRENGGRGRKNPAWTWEVEAMLAGPCRPT